MNWQAANKLKAKIFTCSSLFLLSVFFLPTQFGRHFWPLSSYVLGARVDYLAPTIYFTDVILLVLIFCITFKHKQTALQVFSWIFGRKILFFLVLIMLGIVGSKNPLAGWCGMIRLLEMVFFAAITIWYFHQTRKGFFYLAATLSLAIIFQVSLALLQFFRQGSVGGAFYLLGERFFTSSTPGVATASLAGEVVLRPYGTFSHPNILSGFLLLAIIIIASQAETKLSKNRVALFLLVFGLFFGTLGIAISLSRVAIGGLFFFLLFFSFRLIRQKERSEQFLFWFFSIIFSLLSILLFSAYFYNRFSRESIFSSSLTERLILAEASLSLFAKHMLFGVGLFNFINNLPSVQQSGNLFLQPVHNLFLLILVETGIIGIWGTFLLLANLYKQIRQQPQNFHFFATSLFFAFLALSMVDHYFITSQQGRLMVSLVLGFMFANGNQIVFKPKK